MARPKPKPKARAVAGPPWQQVGRLPSTGVICRLTIWPDDEILIERQPYVSPLDGWTQTYNDLVCNVKNHRYLIDITLLNPATWPG